MVIVFLLANSIPTKTLTKKDAMFDTKHHQTIRDRFVYLNGKTTAVQAFLFCAYNSLTILPFE